MKEKLNRRELLFKAPALAAGLVGLSLNPEQQTQATPEEMDEFIDKVHETTQLRFIYDAHAMIFGAMTGGNLAPEQFLGAYNQAVQKIASGENPWAPDFWEDQPGQIPEQETPQEEQERKMHYINSLIDMSKRQDPADGLCPINLPLLGGRPIS